jgi:hypothetical protein
LRGAARAFFLHVLVLLEKNADICRKASQSGKSGINSAASRGGASGSSGPAAGGSDFYVAPFLFAAIAFCIMRMISISVSLSVTNLLANMTVWFIFESFGNILFLLAFTLIALCWCNIVIRGTIPFVAIAFFFVSLQR